MFLPALHTLVAGLVRRTWAALALVACSAFAAHAVAALVAPEEPAEPHTTAPPTVRKASPPPSVPRKRDGDGFVTRNIFCSICEPVTSAPGSTDTSYSGQPALLIATSIGTEKSATVRVLASETQGSWDLGETIPGVGRIIAIGPTFIDVIDAHHFRARLSLLGPLGSGAANPDPKHAPAAVADAYPGIHPISETDFEVDRKLVRELVSSAANIKDMRIMPIVVDGQVKGVKVTYVKAGSVGAALHLKAGDTITAINNEPLKDVNQLMDLYAKLDKIDGVVLNLMRQQKPVALTLKLM